MTSFAANQTNTHLNDSSDTNPSIFEVLAQQSLSSGLRRASNLLKNILYSNDSQRFYYFYKNFDEIYLLFDICVQFCHLKAFNASFAEYFYNLKRVSVQTNGRLNRKQFYFSLILITLLPYLKNKLDSIFQYLKLKQTNSESEMNVKQLEKNFVELYPVIQTLGQLVSLYYQISYTVGRNSYCSPELHLLRTRLINLEGNDLREKNQMLVSIDPNCDWFTYLAKLSLNSTKLVAKSFGICLSVSAFFIQFLDYWYSSDKSLVSFAPLPIPPPPNKIQTNIPDHKCPICMKDIQNDTTLLTTGFVFCYTCITNHLKEDNRCPVTDYPSTSAHIVKIFTGNG